MWSELFLSHENHLITMAAPTELWLTVLVHLQAVRGEAQVGW